MRNAGREGKWLPAQIRSITRGSVDSAHIGGVGITSPLTHAYAVPVWQMTQGLLDELVEEGRD